MVLCEIEASGSFFSTWVALTLMGLLSQIVFSGGAFWYYYVKPTYELWRWKSNPEYPKPEKVRDEIVQMIKGLCSATLCPAASLYLARHNMSYGYCGLGDYSWGYLVVSFLATWLVSDFCTFTSSANSAALLQLSPPPAPARAGARTPPAHCSAAARPPRGGSSPLPLTDLRTSHRHARARLAQNANQQTSSSTTTSATATTPAGRTTVTTTSSTTPPPSRSSPTSTSTNSRAPRRSSCCPASSRSTRT